MDYQATAVRDSCLKIDNSFGDMVVVFVYGKIYRLKKRRVDL
jgi:hypothetical protein